MNIFEYVNTVMKCYDDKRYWKYKLSLANKEQSYISRLFKLYYLNKCDSRNCASLGNRLNGGSHFKSAPFLPHGIRGIYITDHAEIGDNVTIFQGVTIGVKRLEDKKGPIIGDNCVIGAGAIIIGSVKIGNNVNIGSGTVVWFDVPDNTTVVMNMPRLIPRQ